jgi:hypothetical protein
VLAVTRYTAHESAEWNELVARSKNHVFFFDRRYMDYHADRFRDHSLVFRCDGVPVALLPATADGPTLTSHAGLTFGGLLVDGRMTQPLMLEVFGALVGYLRGAGLSTLVYKVVPHIYHSIPAEEDRYALARHGAALIRRDVNTVAELSAGHAFSDERQRRVEAARRLGIEVRQTGDFAPLWRTLEANLRKKYGLTPAHTLAEIECLHRQWPDRIRLFGAYRNGQFLAGVVVFESECVAHAQYTANTPKGRSLDALDVVFADLLERYTGEKRYFSFGVSSYDDGRELNTGLVAQKEAFGGRTIVHDHYKLTLTKRPVLSSLVP